MAEGDRAWTKHVPPNAVKVLDAVDAEERIKKLVRMGARHV